jgi:hypothetical protein
MLHCYQPQDCMRNVFDLVNVNIEEGVSRKMAPVDSGQVASCIVSES